METDLWFPGHISSCSIGRRGVLGTAKWEFGKYHYWVYRARVVFREVREV